MIKSTETQRDLWFRNDCRNIRSTGHYMELNPGLNRVMMIMIMMPVVVIAINCSHNLKQIVIIIIIIIIITLCP
jgi:hypothetical protein